MRHALSIGLIATVVALSACARQDSAEAPPAAGASGAAAPEPTEQASAEAARTAHAEAGAGENWVGDLTLGTELEQSGAVASDSAAERFAQGQPIHLAAEVNEAPQNATLRVVWYGPNGLLMGESVKQISGEQQYVNFTAQNTSEWVAGDYRAELWANDQKVGEQSFQVVEGTGRQTAGGQQQQPTG